MHAIPHWRAVLDYWFPAALEHADAEFHHAQFAWWFAGGAQPTLGRLAQVHAAATAGALDHWRRDPLGCLALILVLDQVPRGLFAGSPAAYASDAKALAISRRGLREGHYAALTRPWHQTFFLIGHVHAEGADHLERFDRTLPLHDRIAREAPPALRPLYRHSAEQARRHRDVIARFGRYPHRNGVLGRASTAAEAAYIAAGEFVHQRKLPPA